MMELIATQPELVKHACERYLQEELRWIEQMACLGADGIWIEDCLTDMIHPRDYARFNLPFLRRITEAIRSARMQSIHYYCGNPAGKFDLLMDTGADGLALEEGKKGFQIDIEEVVERVNGRCAVLGNLDAIGVLEQASDVELEQEIARQVAIGKRNRGSQGSRFIMSTGSPVTPGTPVERVRRYSDIAHMEGHAQ
jgi:uroporphyrinogen-III decarboxylase